MLEFYESTHSYEWNGARVPGVTSVLKTSGILQCFGTQADLSRGKNVHKMAHMWFDKDLDEPRLPEWLEPYLRGIKNFVAETGFVAEAWEEKIYDKVRRYAGTLDVRGRMRGQRLPVMVDFKTGDIAKWTRIQLAAYTKGKPFLRVAVGISPGLNCGKNYNMKPYGVETLARDLQVFYAGLTIARFMAEAA